MSRIFDALQNARNDVAEKFDDQRNPVELAPVTDLPRGSVRTGDKRFFELLNRLRALPKRRGGLMVALMGATGGEGTTAVAGELADFVARQTGGTTLLLECRPKQLTRVREIQHFARNKARSTMKMGLQVQENAKSSAYTFSTLVFDNADGVDNTEASLDLTVSEYEWVIMDCPPVLRHDYEKEFARLADATILVVESERSETGDVVHASNRLEMADAKLLGVILNKRSNYLPSFLRSILARFGWGDS